MFGGGGGGDDPPMTLRGAEELLPSELGNDVIIEAIGGGKVVFLGSTPPLPFFKVDGSS